MISDKQIQFLPETSATDLNSGTSSNFGRFSIFVLLSVLPIVYYLLEKHEYFALFKKTSLTINFEVNKNGESVDIWFVNHDLQMKSEVFNIKGSGFVNGKSGVPGFTCNKNNLTLCALDDRDNPKEYLIKVSNETFFITTFGICKNRGDFSRWKKI